MSDKMINFVEIESDYNFPVTYINFFSISFFVFNLEQTLHKEPICCETLKQRPKRAPLKAPCLTFRKKARKQKANSSPE